jgi:hypothetical protein
MTDMTHVAKGIGDVIVQNTPPRLTAAQAEEKFGKQPGQVWDAELQEFVALGHALVVEQMGRQVDLAANLQTFKANRDVVIRFVQGEYFEEAKYVLEGKDKGNLIPGQLGDYYKVPGSDQKALTKRGASKIKQLFRWSRGAARRVAGEESKEYCSAMIEVPIVDHLGRTVGAGIGACNTAEKAFTSQNAIKKYGGWCEWDQAKHQLNVTRAPDYRAALHDVTSKATKRADTQATIVAAALEEIFTVARDDEGDPKGEQEEHTPVYPGAAPRFRFPKQIKTKQFSPLAGKLIDDESITVKDLSDLVQWCKATTTNDPAALERLKTAAEEELERRRAEGEADSGSVL